MLVAALGIVTLLAASLGEFGDRGSAYLNPTANQILTISGVERLAWDQDVESFNDLDALEFACVSGRRVSQFDPRRLQR